MEHPEIESKIRTLFFNQMVRRNLYVEFDEIDEVSRRIDDIISKYNEKHRFYHDLAHIDMSLRELKNFNLSRFAWGGNWKINDEKIIPLAIILHDVIYDTRQSDGKNVLQSIEYAKNICKGRDESNIFGFKEEEVQKVCDLIKITDYNKEIKKELSLDEKIIQDLDLVIFGQPKPIFDQYDNNIRKEYWWVPPDIYQSRRKEVLEGFLSKEHIYHTNELRSIYEKVARQNLERTIQKLSD